MASNLCASCSNSIRCYTWGEYRCSVTTRRVYETVTKCDDYVKRPKDWKEIRCGCESCLRNEALAEELEEESEE